MMHKFKLRDIVIHKISRRRYIVVDVWVTPFAKNDGEYRLLDAEDRYATLVNDWGIIEDKFDLYIAPYNQLWDNLNT